MASIIYQLTLYDQNGNEVPGSISYVITEGKTTPASLTESVSSPAHALLEASSEDTLVTVYPVVGSLNAPELTGDAEYPIAGVMYVSLLGPPITTIFTGTKGDTSIGIQFNLLDSPGQQIGGALSWYPEDFGSPLVPWCFLGTRAQ